MAKKKVNKSQVIRDYKESHPDEGPTAIAAAVAEKLGGKISAQYVSTVLNQSKKKSGGKRGRAAKGSGGALDVDALKKAAALIKAIGVDRAREAISLLDSLRS